MIFISGNVPALKNSKQWTGKYLISSERVKEYLKYHGIQSYSSRDKTVKFNRNMQYVSKFKQAVDKLKIDLIGKSAPYKIGFHFVRESRHKFDFSNSLELISDLFIAFQLIEDDNMDIFHPHILYLEGKAYTYDKGNAGVWVSILD